MTVAFFEPEMLSQSVTARFYTLMLAEIAVAILLYQRMMDVPRPSLRLLAANAATQCLPRHDPLLRADLQRIILAAVVVTSLLAAAIPCTRAFP